MPLFSPVTTQYIAPFIDFRSPTNIKKLLALKKLAMKHKQPLN
jgi:hypothetical protein